MTDPSGSIVSEKIQTYEIPASLRPTIFVKKATKEKKTEMTHYIVFQNPKKKEELLINFLHLLDVEGLEQCLPLAIHLSLISINFEDIQKSVWRPFNTNLFIIGWKSRENEQRVMDLIIKKYLESKK